MTKLTDDQVKSMGTMLLPVTEDDRFTIQAAIEYLRAVPPSADDTDSHERRADAAFRIASKLERMINATFRDKQAMTPEEYAAKRRTRGEIRKTDR